ncbi:DUF1709-domain-containing protein [Patellaria atrata CBS 101060]|uniref:DUF1709-domain-containing protein n=1 Tax=Patellaria atrata CBS 101060 TaxID=1346257 RepID=A0A9P4S6I3_9PEZI|nr:DUF1709-domain-containing protein [Patellaria atrata CBS 101060]
MPSEGVQPLRINKGTTNTSPSKMSRPLSEISPMERRRNSPSFNQVTKQTMFNRDTSPYETSPFTNSPRLFWKNRDPTSPGRFSENTFERETTPSSSPRRSSIENLKKASRVKSSTMFAREQQQEYDPSQVPVVERPLASGRPLTLQSPIGSITSYTTNSPLKENAGFKGHRRGESQSKIPLLSPSKQQNKVLADISQPSSPTKSPAREGAASPTKSSLSQTSRYNINKQYEPDTSMFSDDEDIRSSTPRTLRRLAKSVTFDTAPPEINEYEMVTPDPSSIASGSREGSYDSEDYEDEFSFERGSSIDKDDSFDASLEDTDKTPVVLPGDWRHMSPSAANTSLADTFDDPFQPNETSPSATPRRPANLRSGSLNSDGEARPLPPLPGVTKSPSRRESGTGLTETADRINHAQRSRGSLGTPEVSKSDILKMRGDSMSLDDRLRLMGIGDSRDSLPSRQQMRKDQGLGIQVHVDEIEKEETSVLDEFSIPQISRESILRRVKSRNFEDEQDYDYGSTRSSPERTYDDITDLTNLDPDIPIPSRENSSQFDQYVASHPIKREYDSESESELDVYDIPDMYSTEPSPARNDVSERETSVIHHEIPRDTEDDEESRYSSQSDEENPTQVLSHSTTDDEGPPTPKQQDFSARKLEPESTKTQPEESKRMSLPEFSEFLNNSDFNFEFRNYTAPTANEIPKLAPLKTVEVEAMREALQRSLSPVSSLGEELEPPKIPGIGSDSEGSRCDTPDSVNSVIRHPIEPVQRDSPSIPEPVATIKAPGGKLKTRSSISPADAKAIAAARRQVSGEHPPPPPIPARNANRLSLNLESRPESSGSEGSSFGITQGEGSAVKRTGSLKKLDVPVSGISDDLSFGLDKEFDRVIEAQKKGYLMRQNTKVVVASSRQFSDEKAPGGAPAASRGTRSANSSPRKPSAEKTFTTEPWNGKVRRKSVRSNSGNGRRPVTGPAPPLPGQESNVAGGLGSVAEDAVIDDDEFDDGVERGRLFAKVVGVKDLDLPLPKSEQTWFQLTLDNGLHCVTTAWLELGRNAPIGQEFELTVYKDLEFHLTLQTKLEPPPKSQMRTLYQPTKAPKQHKSSTFSRVFGSPKKRKEQERRQQEEAEREAQRQQAELDAQRANHQPTAWELLHDLVGPDGSFARAYVSLKNYEDQAFGRPFTVDVPCFNEWAVEDASINSSVKSKRGGVVRRPPYMVGKLTLQLLFVPMPKNAKQDDMPKSMNACIRELKEAEEIKSKSWEGHLSQQGGDCPYWRRRFFRLNGTKLTAYHETTRQPRATINLAKASKLIDDRSALTQPTSTKSGGRRKSAFSEEEEGYMFVEEGFRIRFANGETIDFYADNAADKEGWMKVLADCVGKEAALTKGWADLVFQHEKAMQAAQKAQVQQQEPEYCQNPASSRKAALSQPEMQNHSRIKSAPNSPVKQHRERRMSDMGESAMGRPPAVPAKERKPIPSNPRERRNVQARDQIRSMIF